MSVWAHDWGIQLDQPVAELPEQSNTVFEDFDNFCKKKYFPKATKTLKNLFVFNQQKLSMWKHI